MFSTGNKGGSIMRKIIIALCILISITLLSCEPNKYYFKNNTRNDEIVSIELITYNADDIEIVDSKGDMLNFNADNMTILETLNQSEVEDFLSEFFCLEFLQGYPHLNTPDGIGVKINYDNGDFLILTDSLVDEDRYGDAIMFNSNGHFLEYFGGLSWRPNFIDLVNKYFQTQIS